MKAKKKKKKVGRPSKFLPDVKEKIISALKSGANFRLAAEYAGIVQDTLIEWRKAGNSPARNRFSEFAEQVKNARAIAQTRNINIINKAAVGGALLNRRTTRKRDGSEVTEETFSRGEWQAAAWWLERSFPEEWGRPFPSMRMIASDGKSFMGMSIEADPNDTRQFLRNIYEKMVLPGDAKQIETTASDG